MSTESGFQFTARTSFARMSEHSWSLVQGQLNACLPTISSYKSNRENALRKSYNTPASLLIFANYAPMNN